MSNYYLSNGEKMSKTAIDKKIAVSKREKWEQQLDWFGYNFCEHCAKFEHYPNQTQFDTSHIISTKECQEMRKTEIAYDINNLEVVCRQHHIEHENKSLKERIKIYESKL